MNQQVISRKKTQEEFKPMLLNAITAAKLLGISRAHLYRLHNAGKIPLPVRLGGSVRWRANELTEWVEAGMPNRKRWINRNGGAA